ncbi:MAG: DUF4270 domain-containing protein [Bacteroidaceae bacterium]
MKINKLKIWFCASAMLLPLVACDNTTESIGTSMISDQDKIEVENKTFEVYTKSVAMDSVYAKTKVGYVGQYDDPTFGEFHGNFLSELNCVDGLSFPWDIMTDKKAYATEIYLYYNEFFGDSLNTSQIKIYELNKRLTTNYYTNTNPENFFDKADLIATKSYTASDQSLSDDAKSTTGYVPYVYVKLDNSIGQRIIDMVNPESDINKSTGHPAYYKDANDFMDNVFKGIYVESSMADGTVLYIDDIFMNVAFETYAYDDDGVKLTNEAGNDSTVYLKRTFASTQEVLQANQITNSTKIDDLVADQSSTYIKSPAGIMTEVELPLNEISAATDGNTINAASIKFQSYIDDDDSEYVMPAPTYLLLVRAKDYKSFFEDNDLPDSYTSFYTNLTTSGNDANKYVFSNISNLIKYCIAEKEDAREEAGSWTAEQEKAWEIENQWNKMYLVPINLTYGGTNDATVISVENNLSLTKTKLIGGNDTIDLNIIYTKFNKK